MPGQDLNGISRIETPRPTNSKFGWTSIASSFNRIIRLRTNDCGSDDIAGPQSRTSINASLALNTRHGHERSHDAVATETDRGLLGLPTEIRHLIEEYLPLIDLLCFQQASRRLRHESSHPAHVKELTYVQRYRLRRRLDHDRLLVLQSLETGGKLGNRIAICSFCTTVHDKANFTLQQLAAAPDQRTCIAANTKTFVMGSYSTYPPILRRALEDVLATGRHTFWHHHYMPNEDKQDAIPMSLSAVIEDDPRAKLRRATLFVDSSGLVVQHQFHFQAQNVPMVYHLNLSAALAHPCTRLAPICPHYTVYSAGTIVLDGETNPTNNYTGSCTEESCRTVFGWFDCPMERNIGRMALCFRVQRRFGWMENAGSTNGGTV